MLAPVSQMNPASLEPDIQLPEFRITHQMIESAPWLAISLTQNVVFIDAAALRKAEDLIESCEACNPEGAEIPFDNILDRVTGSDPSVTDYVLEEPAKCLSCRCEVLEKTLVVPA